MPGTVPDIPRNIEMSLICHWDDQDLILSQQMSIQIKMTLLSDIRKLGMMDIFRSISIIAKTESIGVTVSVRPFVRESKLSHLNKCT